jgi:dTMP kinase
MTQENAASHGLFVTFEGGEGSGKSTQIQLLAEHLRTLGREVVVTREPGGSTGAEALRQVILSGDARHLGSVGETLLFAAARADHVDQLIRPALTRGADVLCDRFIDSTRVYQGLTEDVDTPLLERLEDVALGGLRPDLTFILDIPAAEGLQRAAGRRGEDAPDRFEEEAVEVHEARRQAFLAIAAGEPHRCLVVDAARTPDEVAREIAELVDAVLDRPRNKAVGE